MWLSFHRFGHYILNYDFAILCDFCLLLVRLPWVMDNLTVFVAELMCCACTRLFFASYLEERFSKTCNSSLDMVFAKSCFKGNPRSDSSTVGKTLTAALFSTIISPETNWSLPRETLLWWSKSSAEPQFLRFCCVLAACGLCFGPGDADSQL